MNKAFLYIVFCVLIACSEKPSELKHKGMKKISFSGIQLDSFVRDVSYSSTNGNFFMTDSSVIFADSYYATFFCYDLDSFQMVNKHFRLGRGAGELNQFLFAYPVNGEEHTCFTVDKAIQLRSVDMRNWKANMSKSMLFDWTQLPNADYSRPSNYNISTNSFGVFFTRINDSLYYFPVRERIEKSSFGREIEKSYWKESRIFGILNRKTMKIDSVFGRLPVIYQTRSIPHIVFFDYATTSDTIWVSHGIDSLIYVYKFPDKFLYTFGYEGREINREYSETNDLTQQVACFKEDMQKVGFITNLTYIKETGILFRMYMKNMKDRTYGMQIYKENDLIADLDVPSYFKVIGYQTPYYYAVRTKSIDTENESYFVFYKFRL